VLTKIGRDARLEIEGFIDKRVYLELFVKVDKDWRSTDGKLRKYGYKS
jgi:GTP-binding protein Era